MHLLWLWDERELCLLQGGICGQYNVHKLYMLSCKNVVILICCNVKIALLTGSNIFSNQNAEAALLHGADVKEMIEEPMKVNICYN